MNVLIWLSIGLDRRTPSFHLIKEIIDQLINQNCDITVIQKNSGGGFDYLSLINNNVRFINIKCKNPSKNNFLSRYLTDLSYFLKCKKILKKNHAYESVFIQSSNIAGIQTELIKRYNKNSRIVYNVQDLFPNNLLYSKKMKNNNILYKILSHFQFKAYINSDKIITISQDIRNELLSIGVEKNKIDVIYNWSYQDDVYDNANYNNDFINDVFNNDFFNVVYAGNIGVMQNVDVVIKAANILKNDKTIRFIIIGDGIYKNKLITIKNELNLDNVMFYDMQSSELAPIIYQKADINIVPLKKDIYKTALPSKIATCLACQKPIIFCLGIDSIFGRETMKQTNCPCIDSNDYKMLAENILKIKNNKVKISTKEYFLKYFLKTTNGKKYANIILNK